MLVACHEVDKRSPDLRFNVTVRRIIYHIRPFCSRVTRRRAKIISPGGELRKAVFSSKAPTKSDSKIGGHGVRTAEFSEFRASLKLALDCQHIADLYTAFHHSQKTEYNVQMSTQ